jgi:hypothetical protein
MQQVIKLVIKHGVANGLTTVAFIKPENEHVYMKKLIVQSSKKAGNKASVDRAKADRSFVRIIGKLVSDRHIHFINYSLDILGHGLN